MPPAAGTPAPGPHYKWIALSNTTLGVLIATINASILLISLPDIFRGIGVNPLLPGSTGLLLWLIMGYLVVTAVLVVSFGRLGDMYGRVRIYNLGFAVFSVFSVLLSVTWLHGTQGALWLIAMRVLQGVGGAMLMANSSAILTDAFPWHQRGLALGLNQVAGIAGSFIGLVLGGLLGPVEWRLVFLVSVPFGVFGTFWAYLKLRELAERRPARLDWWGNLTFAAGLIALLVGITYAIQPYGGHTMGWTNPFVMGPIGGGLVVLVTFCIIETKVADPMFRLGLFRLRSFSAGNLANLLAGLGRGGLMFVLIIWLQGIYLPRHGYSFSQTPLWAGIYMLPLTGGFLLAGPLSGWLSDRFGARLFATGGMVVAAASFLLLELLPVDFSYWQFALIILLNGIGMGLFASPNRAAIMNSLPPGQRGVGSGMTATFQNSAMVLSIGVFFTLIILGLAASLPATLLHGLTTQGVPGPSAAKVASLPPVAVLFASLLGYNPVQTLLGPVLAHLPAGKAAYLAGRGFFPSLITPAFSHGLSVAFNFAIAACLVAAVASLLRGKRYVHDVGAAAAAEPVPAGAMPAGAMPAGAVPAGAGPAAAGGNGAAAETASVLAGGNGHAIGQIRRVTIPGPQPAGDADGLAAPAAASPAAAAAVQPPAAWAPAAQPPAAQAPMAYLPGRAAAGDVGGRPAATGPAIRGRVLQADGTPVTSATVTAIDSAGRQAGRAGTGDGGWFLVPLPSRGSYTVIAIASGLQPQASAVLVGDRPADRDLRLPGTGSLGGTVREAPSGTPLAGAAVSLADETGEVVGSQQADAAGRYRFDGLGGGSYTLAVSAPSCHPAALPVAVADGRSVSLDAELCRGSKLTGAARTAGGNAVPDARVTLLDPAGNLAGAATTGPDGAFSFDNLAPGEYTVIASGYPPMARKLTISPSRAHAQDIQLGHPED